MKLTAIFYLPFSLGLSLDFLQLNLIQLLCMRSLQLWSDDFETNSSNRGILKYI